MMPKWSGKTRNVSSELLALEDEICILRKQMEQMFQEEQSFTAEKVIEISRLLDVKINEYMKSHVKK
ncbi:aspartyl-phosphate phosphatase Spo0E family protein [Paenibacillus sp. 481]|nr:aspartyl-phosphate phosphatase Spo0E family protein [Paenibacillus sp. 481]UHA76130.1 aspartyl-phosphate phosphatase Spo0E family protein [Paenibacillus sp. 481]